MDVGRATTLFKEPKFLVIGHRGNGMNMLQSSDLRMKAIKENTILSFNTAGKHPIDFIEFDVQVYNMIFRFPGGIYVTSQYDYFFSFLFSVLS